MIIPDLIPYTTSEAIRFVGNYVITLIASDGAPFYQWQDLDTGIHNLKGVAYDTGVAEEILVFAQGQRIARSKLSQCMFLKAGDYINLTVDLNLNNWVFR